ncbi:hypothetical protein ACXR2U_22965 [Jatrophihabitans sp. YIM 134969]
MPWLVGLVVYAAGVVATLWLTANVEFFEMVCFEDRRRMSVVWPFTWLAAGCVALLYATSVVHERIVGRHDPGRDVS